MTTSLWSWFNLPKSLVLYAEIYNLALATGNFGRPGAGYGTLTGQGNGQGGREVGQKATQLPGCREIENPEDRAYICSVWGIDEQELPHAGYPATLMVPAMLRQEIRACLLICSNPLVSLPDQHTAEKAFRGLDLFVVLDFFLSETAELADIVLPGNVWAEDEGTTTSSPHPGCCSQPPLLFIPLPFPPVLLALLRPGKR